MTALILFLEFLPSLILLIVIYFLLRPIVNGAVYFPTSRQNIETMLTMADAKPGQKVADLGSGDGRILIAFARAGAEAHGYEVNPLLVRKSRRAIKAAGLERKALVHWQSLWRVDLSPFDVVVIYGIPYIMKKLRHKLERELKAGAKVISNIYPFPGWTPHAAEDRVYLYNKE